MNEPGPLDTMSPGHLFDFGGVLVFLPEKVTREALEAAALMLRSVNPHDMRRSLAMYQEPALR